MVDFFREGLFQILQQRSVRRQLGRFIYHPVVLLAIATIFATLAGVWLTNYYQDRAWLREKQFEAFQQGYAEALRLVDELSELMSRRFFGLNRALWAAKGTGTGELEQVWSAYYETVVEWNTRIMSYRSRLARSVDSEVAQALGSWDDPYAADPRTIHGRFYQAHEQVRALVECVRDRCSGEDRQAALEKAQQAVNELGVAIERFTDACTARIHHYASTS